MADNDTASTAATNPLDESRRTTDWAFRLLKDVDEFFGNPIGARLDAKALKERLNKELGPWHDFLYDKERDVYYRPVLATTKFNTYMKLRYQAGFQPKGKCTATARWAQLVHALGITPDMNIVDKSALEPGDEQNIRLKVDGQVVCHIVNILQSVDEYPDRPWAETGFDTEVGSFSWDHLTSKYRELQYQPLGEEKMAQMHPYFPRFQQRRSGSTNADELWMRYELALSDVGISDTTFAWPDPKTTITERLEKRTKFINDLKSLEFQQRPMFIAQKWKFDADRILCRAIDAGRVDKLLQDACVPENCHGSDQIRQALLSDLQKPDEDITDRSVSPLALFFPSPAPRLPWRH